jgi:hypothetical protein
MSDDAPWEAEDSCGRFGPARHHLEQARLTLFGRHVIFEQERLPRSVSGPVAQLVEHRTFNAVVAGSIPARLTMPYVSCRT